MIFLENPLYISWAICVSLLLACCKSPSVRDSVFLPTLQPGVSHPWEHKPGDGDSRSKRKRLCPADSSLPGECKVIYSCGRAKRPIYCRGRRQDKDLRNQLFSPCCSQCPFRQAAPHWAQCPVDVWALRLLRQPSCAGRQPQQCLEPPQVPSALEPM